MKADDATRIDVAGHGAFVTLLVTVCPALVVTVKVYVSGGHDVPSRLQYTPYGSTIWKRLLLVKPVAAPLIESVTTEFGAKP